MVLMVMIMLVIGHLSFGEWKLGGGSCWELRKRLSEIGVERVDFSKGLRIRLMEGWSVSCFRRSSTAER